MASFMSQPRQFTNYTPEYNAELYANLLQKKEKDYQEGIQRVEASREAVASLPIYNAAGKEYLNQKLSAITTELNQSQGTDWSDQGIQRLTNKHISLIADDPEVQKAVSYSAMYKKDYLQDKEQYDKTDGKSWVNHKDFERKASNWLNGPLGTQYGAEFTPYSDIVGDFGKYYKDKHPDTKINIQYAGIQYGPDGNPLIDHKTGKPVYSSKDAMMVWDAKVEKWKELTALEVQTDFEGFINSNPLYQKQMQLNGRYTNEHLGAGAAIGYAAEVYSKKLQNTERDLKTVTTTLANMSPDDPDYEAYQKKEIYLKEQQGVLKNALTPEFLLKQREVIQNSPELLEGFREQIYKESLYNDIANRYAYREMESVNLEGDSPFQKQYKQKQMDNDIRYKEEMISIQKERNAIARERIELTHAAALAKQRQQQVDTGAAEYGTPTDHPDPWIAFNEQLENKALFVENQKTTYMYDKWGQQFPELFSIGNDFKARPINDKARQQLQDMYDKKYYAYKHADLDENGNKVDLDREDRDHFRAVDNAERVSRSMLAIVNAGKQGWKTRPEAQMQEQGLSALINYADANASTYGMSGQDIRHYIEAVKEIKYLTNDKMSLLQGVATVLAGTANEQQYNIYSKHLLGKAKPTEQDKQKIRTILGGISYMNKTIAGEGLSPLDAYAFGTDKENEFLNNYVTANNYLINKQFIPWINPKTGFSDKVIKDRVVPLLHGEKSAMIDQKKVTSVGYVQDAGTGGFKIVLLDAQGKTEEYDISKREAMSHGFTDLQAEDELSQLLRVNRSQTGTSSNTWFPDKSPAYSNALYLTNNEFNGAPHEIKYHVKEANGVKYLEFWVRNMQDPKDRGHIAKDKFGKKIQAASTSLTDIRIALQNFAGTSSVKAPAQYYGTTEGQEIDNSTEEE